MDWSQYRIGSAPPTPQAPEAVGEPKTDWNQYKLAKEPQPQSEIYQEDSLLKRVGREARSQVGVATGMGELANPVQWLRGVEVMANLPQAVYQEGITHPLKALERASNMALTPDIRVDDIAAGYRTGVDVASDLASQLIQGKMPKLADIQKTYESEKTSQDEFKKWSGGQEARTIGEIIPAVVGIGEVLAQTPKLVKGLAALRSVRSVVRPDTVTRTAAEATAIAEKVPLSAAATTRPPLPKNIQEAQTLTRELLGDVSSEIGDAIFNRSAQVRQRLDKLIEGGGKSDDLFNVVKDLRNHVDTTQNFIGQMVGDFRTLIAQNTSKRVPTEGYQSIINGIRRSARIGGQSDLTASETAMLDNYAAMFRNSTARVANRETMAPKDMVKIIDSLDNRLKTFYKNPGAMTNVSRDFMSKLARIRGRLDDDLADSYPAFKQLKTVYSQFKDTADPISSKIAGQGAESFLANIQNQNKTEIRNQLGALTDYSEQAANQLKKLSLQMKTGDQELSGAARALVGSFRRQAREAKFANAQGFFNDIADSIAARKLYDASYGGLTDMRADRIQRLITKYVDKSVSKGTGIGATIGSAMGAGTSRVLGIPQIAGAGAGGYAGAKAGAWIAKGIAQPKAEALYNPQRIFELIAKDPNATSALKQHARQMIEIGKSVGSDVMMKIANTVSVSGTRDMDALEKAVSIYAGERTLLGVSKPEAAIEWPKAADHGEGKQVASEELPVKLQ